MFEVFFLVSFLQNFSFVGSILSLVLNVIVSSRIRNSSDKTANQGAQLVDVFKLYGYVEYYI